MPLLINYWAISRVKELEYIKISFGNFKGGEIDTGGGGGGANE